MAPSSPIIFPSSPASQGTKRPRTKDVAPTSRTTGGFVLDDSDSDDDGGTVLPLAKKQMIEPPSKDTVEKQQQQQQPLLETLATPPVSDETPEPNAQQQELDMDFPDLQSQLDKTQFESTLPTFTSSLFETATRTYELTNCAGKSKMICLRKEKAAASYESMVAARSRTKEGRAKRAYYGIDIHDLIRVAETEIQVRKDAPPEPPPAPEVPVMSIEAEAPTGKRSRKAMLWTEKYRAKKFMDLCGDDGTNRMVLRWIKKWDPLVFPGSEKARPKKPLVARQQGSDQPPVEEKPLRKILLLTGPPGLGKTTLAHVCAKQAGYEVLEVNASDDRSKNVVNNRIRTTLGTETVKTVQNPMYGSGKPLKPAKPVCVIVDEVDGVTTGAGASGEGGFIKALVDLVLIDQKNSSPAERTQTGARRKKKGDDFRQMRPLILICNDVYHPSLRPLRQSNLAEIIHVGKPTLDAVVGRLANVFEKEGILCDKDAARKLCECAWGMATGIDAKKGTESTVEGDLRGVMVVGEWVAGRFKSTSPAQDGKLTRHWIDKHVAQDLTNGAGARGSGRGGIRDVVSRVFQEGAGFPKPPLETQKNSKTRHEQPKAQLGFSELHKRHGMDKLREMVDASGDVDRIMSDVLGEYPEHEYNDDMYLSKPNQAYDWLHFLDECSTRLFSGQEWELSPYLSQPILACHSLFASPIRMYGGASGGGAGSAQARKWGAAADDETELQSRFSGPRASYNAHEAEKHNRAVLQAMQSDLSPTLMRSFRSAEAIASEFLPYLTRMVSPGVNPVVVGGGRGLGTASVRKESERNMVERAARVMAEVGITLQKGMIENDTPGSRGPQWVYRLEPDLDALSAYETLTQSPLATAPTRYAVRQVLDQALQKTKSMQDHAAALARSGRTPSSSMPLPLPSDGQEDKENAKPVITTTTGREEKPVKVRKDFFGRVLADDAPLRKSDGNGSYRVKVWVKYHEGLNNAVRRPITLKDFVKIL